MGNDRNSILEGPQQKMHEESQGTSPTPRPAAYYPDVDLVGRSPAFHLSNADFVTLSEIEGRYVACVLEHTGGNKQAAARILAVDRKTLDRMIKRHHIDCPHVRGRRAKTPAQS
jgi:DNA-binding NtrC family response regulator